MSDDQNSLIAEYLKSSEILIVDESAGARVGLTRLLISMGAITNKIQLTGATGEAERLISVHKPNLVFCDYKIGDEYGLDLLQKQREEFPKEANRYLFVLVTSNTSQSAVAQAAEEDVDAYILKPYTVESFSSLLRHAIQSKVMPSDYQKLIQSGKELLDQDRLEEAMEIFKMAMEKDNTPSLACFYEGLVHYKKTSLNDSELSFQKGLGFNRIHYKCLVGLFDLLMTAEKFEAAYDIVQRIVQFFPANPKRLTTVLKLAIRTKHYSDVVDFYQGFLKIDERNDELVKSICAALIVCGKHYFEVDNPKMGEELIIKASISAAGRTIILRKAIEALVQHDLLDKARAVLPRFPSPEEKGLEDPQYTIACFIIYSKEETMPGLIAGRGQEILKQGISDPILYRITIDNFDKLGKPELAEKWRKLAMKIFPELGYG